MTHPGPAPDGTAPDEPGPSRRAVVEGVAVAVVAGVAGFSWFSATGPMSEDEREELEDRQDEERDELEDRQDDERDELEDRREDGDRKDRSGPDRGRG